MDETPRPPGWYQDPNNPALVRFWTGSSWTALSRPADSSAQSHPLRQLGQSGALPVSGWYVDPVTSQRLRYWDGAQWTGLTGMPTYAATFSAEANWGLNTQGVMDRKEDANADYLKRFSPPAGSLGPAKLAGSGQATGPGQTTGSSQTITPTGIPKSPSSGWGGCAVAAVFVVIMLALIGSCSGAGRNAPTTDDNLPCPGGAAPVAVYHEDINKIIISCP